MQHNRRNFLKATAVASIASAAPAQAATNDPWIGVIHSTSLDADLELAFYDGLRLQGQGYEADPMRDLSAGMTRMNVLCRHVQGKYRRGSYAAIGKAVQDILDTLGQSNLKAIVAVGGLIVGKAAALQLTSKGSTVPLATIIGRQNTEVGSYVSSAGFYFDDNSTVARTLSDKVAELLQYPGMDAQSLWLLYNGNSEMGFDEKAAWESVLNRAPYNVASPNSINAALDSSGNAIENKDIKLRNAFQIARNRGAKAIVVSSDPYFTRHLSQIVRIAGSRAFANIIMCYPVLEYSDEASDAGMGTANYFALGPRVTDVYSKLGALVGNWVKTGAAPNPRFSRVIMSHSSLDLELTQLAGSTAATAELTRTRWIPLVDPHRFRNCPSL